MQLTSTTGAVASERSALSGVLARLNRPAAASAIAFIGWLAYVLARWQVWAAGHITLFIMSGSRRYSHPSQMVPRISHVPSLGYDGQFYYRFARNPFNWDPTAYGITVDHNYRYTRIGYSLVAWVFSLGGNARLLPTVLVVLNLVFVALIAFVGAQLAADHGRHALWGLAFVAYFGLVISVGRNTSEPLADLCMLAGILAYRRSAYIWAAALIAYGVFTNEPILVLPVAFAVVRLWAIVIRRTSRPAVKDLVWFVPGAVYVILQVFEKLLVHGQSGGVSDFTSNLTWPFGALIPGLYRDLTKMSWTHLGMYDYNVLEFIALAIVVVAGLMVIRAARVSAEEKAAFIGFVGVELVIASSQFWYSVFGDGRTFIDAYLMAVIVLLATPAGAVTGAVTSATVRARTTLLDKAFPAGRVMPGKRLGWLMVVPVIVLILVPRRHILFQ